MAELFFEDNTHIVSKTDVNGKITYGNELFYKLSGYSRNEIINMPHNIIRHPDMPRCIFKFMWEKIKAGNEIFAYVKNRSKNNDFYWVFANITPSFDNNQKIIGFHSVRRKPKMGSVEKIEKIYLKLLSIEKSLGITAAEKELVNILEGKEYDIFIQEL